MTPSRVVQPRHPWERVQFRETLTGPEEWEDVNFLKFNKAKGQVLHLGWGDLGYTNTGWGWRYGWVGAWIDGRVEG